MPLPAEPDDEATASDSDPEPEPRRNRIPTVSKSPEPPAPVSQEKPSRKIGGLGIIGGKKSKEGYSVAPAQPRSSPEHQAPQKSPQEDRFNDSPPPTSSTPPQREANVKRPGKLGMIGGKAKAKVPVPVQKDPSPPVVETRALSPDQSSLTKSKATREATPDVARKEGTPLSSSRAAETSTAGPPAELETDEQRADRRREELKRALEAKGKAPAKKKRRF